MEPRYWSRCEQLKSKSKDAENLLESYPHQCVEMERCESKELDVEIRSLIEKNNASQLWENPEPLAQECPNSQRTSCSLKTCTETNAQSHFGCAWADVNDEMEASPDQLESKHLLLTKKKTISADSVEQQILSLERQRRELLEVNKQWDHQFRRMKQHYEKKLAEMKAKLDMSQRRVSELEEERYRNHPENERLRVLGRDGPLQETKDIKVLTDALHEIKEENKLLKEKNASMIRRKEHYECEISRLNKALLGILKKQHSSVLENPSEKSGRSSLEDMQTQLEVLRQQVQIYEEDFRKERSDRERLNEEKEALQKINESLQSQLSKRHSQIETCVKEKEQLERQLQQQKKDLPGRNEQPSFPPPLFLSPCVNYGNCGLLLHYQDPRVHPMSRGAHEQQQRSPDYQWYVPDQFPPDVQHKANDTSSEKGAHP
ncbi:TNFAIP3-interacting protein 3 isoform X4 [Struthio camelus]|uniref:TNFAIP3-interacting protein 3 isoform X4 n=1 Tax=Struthio camelus TaxID=8801 RepID=UPI0024008C8F